MQVEYRQLFLKDLKKLKKQSVYNGRRLGQSQSTRSMSTGDNIRGWNWHDSSGSYIVAE